MVLFTPNVKTIKGAAHKKVKESLKHHKIKRSAHFVLFPHTCEQTLVGLQTRIFCATAHSVRPGRQVLYRLSYAGSAISPFLVNHKRQGW